MLVELTAVASIVDAALVASSVTVVISVVVLGLGMVVTFLVGLGLLVFF